MPRLFNAEKKEEIRNQLISEGKEMMLEEGITKMNLEKLAYSAGIAKGTFYNFFKTKQHFILAIIRTYQQQQYEILNQTAQQRKGTLSVTEAVQMFLTIYDPKTNPMFHMRERDLDWIAEKIPAAELFDAEMDLKCCRLILSCVKNLRQDVDYRIVSNFSRMIMFTLMQKECVHQEVLETNIRMIINMTTHYILQDDNERNGGE